MSAVFSLSIHADYQCRHSGACCSTDWDVPVELPVYRALNERIDGGSLRVAPSNHSLQPFIVEPDLPDETAAILERTERGECVFFDIESHLCVVHRDAGEQALPATCRNFPRLSVRDSRGTFVTLSHYCPTAASMLFRDDVPLNVVEAPPAFPLRDYDGLTVSDEDLPPLLTPTMLTDPTGYSAWERHMVRRCAADCSPESVLATLAADVARLRGWRPGGASLAEAVGTLPDSITAVLSPRDLTSSLERTDEVSRAVPHDWQPPRDHGGLREAYAMFVLPMWETFGAPINRYLAGKAFASWTAYQGKGLATIVRGLEAALALVRVEASRQGRDARRRLDRDLLLEAFRRADFILNHLAVGEDLAAVWSRAEDE